ncbi:neuropeptide FF receptor 1 like 2 [Amia ocellicauda]|uniref:neuropeptide FF receptor 1 like 2 n=1 Tax=Amia ocellicauda TaxID=2972642 RepID=UPI0034644BCE
MSKELVETEELRGGETVVENSSHTSSNVTYSPYYQHSPPVAASFILAYLFIFGLCMLGNGLVCLIVLRNRRMRTVTNLFILNLAVSDLLVGIFCIPTTLVDNLITGWPFTNAVCKMSGLVQGMSVSASVFTLVAIAVDRFRCIVHPFKPKLTLLVAVVTIVVIWVLAVAIMCPSAVMLMVGPVENHYMVHNGDYNHTYQLYSCYEAWPDKEMRKVYTTVLFTHIYLAPLTLIVFMYGRIGAKLYTSSMPTSDRMGEGRAPISKKKVKVIKMLIVVALLFMLSWLPLWSLMLLTDYAKLSDEQIGLLTGYIFPFAHWLAFSNSSVNPIIYGYFNENFKRGFQAAFRLPCCSGGAGPRDTYCSRDGALKPMNFGMRNKVYTDGDSSESGILEKERRRNVARGNGGGGALALAVGGGGEGGGTATGVSKGPQKRGLHIEDIEKITPLGAGVCQAWDP